MISVKLSPVSSSAEPVHVKVPSDVLLQKPVLGWKHSNRSNGRMVSVAPYTRSTIWVSVTCDCDVLVIVMVKLKRVVLF